MSDRRPHWDDDLILAVAQAHDEMHKPHENSAYWTAGFYREELLHPLIAAVEDWQARTVVPTQVLDMAVRAHQAEAAIQRVRELHSPTTGFNGYLWCSAHCESTADGDPTDYPCATIRALDGDA